MVRARCQWLALVPLGVVALCDVAAQDRATGASSVSCAHLVAHIDFGCADFHGPLDQIPYYALRVVVFIFDFAEHSEVVKNRAAVVFLRATGFICELSHSIDPLCAASPLQVREGREVETRRTHVRKRREALIGFEGLRQRHKRGAEPLR